MNLSTHPGVSLRTEYSGLVMGNQVLIAAFVCRTTLCSFLH
jgi:hypothetical protein